MQIFSAKTDIYTTLIDIKALSNELPNTLESTWYGEIYFKLVGLITIYVIV